METFTSSLSPATLNGNGHSHSDSNAYSPAPTTALTPIDPTPSLLSAWQLNAQQEEDSDLRNLLSIVRRRAWVITGVAAVAMSLITGHALRQEKVYRGQFQVLVEPVNADEDFSELTSV
ncbi:MAG: Wzz/FepE/Etk N-terminal domain-containing protein, partial [Cyanobacteria bacterium P01_F01_bin.3]